ncbi:glycosyltransferase family 2 protein [Tunicatimonas pelagia]|uniref:glycosyltransferase family 2 protein n=1 Tax=Tunicatimonas pelagia TaxID=931531 RepID=UPI002666161B|nr:glycosyltransferase family 2 protein [Tunicatimonas pelagia]WKN44448.1 glycosyltransferase family 2 protein [Tunicatimonas pelagia]
MSDRNKAHWPKISIVTPSYNQGQYIEETILSVINQNYPNLEYIIIDGGSTDNTVEIIKNYEKHITYWVSEPDQGQSHAINKGFKKSTGDILGWINSDDYYTSDTFSTIVDIIQPKQLMLLYGNASYYFQDTDSFKEVDVVARNRKKILPFDLGFIQPATFWTKWLWEEVGELNEELHYAFDLDWYLRGLNKGKHISTSRELAIYRIHGDHKTSNGGEEREKEILTSIDKNGYRKYANVLSNLNRRVATKSSFFTDRLLLGKAFFSIYRVFNPSLWKLSVNEISQLFTKRRAM